MGHGLGGRALDLVDAVFRPAAVHGCQKHAAEAGAVPAAPRDADDSLCGCKGLQILWDGKGVVDDDQSVVVAGGPYVGAGLAGMAGESPALRH